MTTAPATSLLSPRALVLALGVAAAVGILASAVMSIEAFHSALTWGDLRCEAEEVAGCTEAAPAAHTELLGFPNALLGLAAWPVVVTVAVARLAGARLPSWTLLVVLVGALAGLALTLWEVFQGAVVAGDLDPWTVVALLAALAATIATLRLRLDPAESPQRR